MKNSKFTTFDIIKTINIPRERLQDWINREFIKPTTPAKGQGTKALFTINDVYQIELFRQLIEFGFKREFANKYIKNGMFKNIPTIDFDKIKTKVNMALNIQGDLGNEH